MAFPLANEPETMTHMSSYEPDPDTAKLFARHKQATRTIKDTKKPVAEAVEKAIRQGATSPQLAELTGLTSQTIRNIAEKIGIDIRLKAPTVGREVEIKRAQGSPDAPEPNERPSPPESLGVDPRVTQLSEFRLTQLANWLSEKKPDWYAEATEDVDPDWAAHVAVTKAVGAHHVREIDLVG